MQYSLTMHLDIKEEQHAGYFLSSLFQGVLMEQINPDYAAHLHEISLHPYSQALYRSGNEWLWRVNGLNQEAKREIIDPLNAPDFRTIHLRSKDFQIPVLSKEQFSAEETSLVEQYFIRGEGSKTFRINFLTPTSFKQNGSYCIFPSVRLIFQSLMHRFDAFSEDAEVYSDEVLEQFEEYVQITGYRLRSTSFSMEHTRIPSFLGEVTVRVHGPQQMANLARMLVKFGEFSGVGIKTGMGMGAIQLLESRR